MVIAQRGVNTLSWCIAGNCRNNGWKIIRFLICLPKPSAHWRRTEEAQTGLIDVAIIQSLVKQGNSWMKPLCDYGHLVVDECHHLSSRSTLNRSHAGKGEIVTGLSLRLRGKDGHHPSSLCNAVPFVIGLMQRYRRPHVHLTHPVHGPSHGLSPLRAAEADLRVQYSELMDSELIADKGTRSAHLATRAGGRSRRPVAAHIDRTQRTSRFPGRAVSPGIQHFVVLRGGTGKKEAAAVSRPSGGYPDAERRDCWRQEDYSARIRRCRLDTLFLTLPVPGRYDRAVRRPFAPAHDASESARIDYADLTYHAGSDV